jgi:hypothetical protein
MSIDFSLISLFSGGPVQPAYNSYFLTCFFGQNHVFLFKKIAGTVFKLVFQYKRTGLLGWLALDSKYI